MKKLLALSAHPAHWPWPARTGLLLAVAVACAAGGLALYAAERSAVRQVSENRRAQLQAQFTSALANSAGLAALRLQEGELGMRLATAEDQLWPASGEQASLLQAKLARRAEECGLTMESFKPLAGSPASTASTATSALTAPDGAQISISGSYAQLLRFVELATAPPQPVQFESMDIARDTRGDQETLLMNATVSIFLRTNTQKGT